MVLVTRVDDLTSQGTWVECWIPEDGGPSCSFQQAFSLETISVCYSCLPSGNNSILLCLLSHSKPGIVYAPCLTAQKSKKEERKEGRQDIAKKHMRGPQHTVACSTFLKETQSKTHLAKTGAKRGHLLTLGVPSKERNFFIHLDVDLFDRKTAENKEA